MFEYIRGFMREFGRDRIKKLRSVEFLSLVGIIGFLFCLLKYCVYSKPECLQAGCWVEAEGLRIGDRLMLADGNDAVVEGITAENNMQKTMDFSPGELGVKEPTYNIAVAGTHTYYVGENGVWVHNQGGFPCDIENSVIATVGDTSEGWHEGLQLFAWKSNATQYGKLYELELNKIKGGAVIIFGHGDAEYNLIGGIPVERVAKAVHERGFTGGQDIILISCGASKGCVGKGGILVAPTAEVFAGELSKLTGASVRVWATEKRLLIPPTGPRAGRLLVLRQIFLSPLRDTFNEMNLNLWEPALPKDWILFEARSLPE
jgi:hypothetical protein